MKAPILKRVAHWAKHDLASKNAPLGSGQIHQVLAAMLGFNSLAAFEASSALEVSTLTSPTLVKLDTTRAMSRCQALSPSLPAELIVARLTHVLEQASTAELLFVGGYRSDCRAFVSRGVLAQPRMADAADEQVQEGGSRTYVDNGVCVVEAEGEYDNAQGESGSFDLQAWFAHQAGAVYVLERMSVDFRPGQFDELVIDEFTGFDHG